MIKENEENISTSKKRWLDAEVRPYRLGTYNKNMLEKAN